MDNLRIDGDNLMKMRAALLLLIAIAIAACEQQPDICGSPTCDAAWTAHDAAIADGDGGFTFGRCLVDNGCTTAPGLAAEAPAPACSGRPAIGDDTIALRDVPPFSLISDGLTQGDEALQVGAASDPFTQFWLDCDRVAPTKGLVDTSALAPGVHEILVARGGKAIAAATFRRVHAVYIVTTIDWEGATSDTASIDRQRSLHDAHDELVLTQLVGPYMFTSGVDDATLEDHIAFLHEGRDTFGDEIGVHIHARCSFIESAGVTCLTGNSLQAPLPDASGYSVPLADYTFADTVTLFEHAIELFEENDLGTPTSFRAGGWAADADTLRALGEAGFLVDTSAHNWSRLEEWRDLEPFSSLYRWHTEHWSEIGDLSQPYWPADDDAQRTGQSLAGILEVPDNASLVDYVTAREMQEIFYATWLGLDDTGPRVLSIGYHAATFDELEGARMNGALDVLDRYRASQGTGPVVYVRLSDLVSAFPRP